MSSQTLRSVYRARPELAQAGQALRGYFRHFSTTQSQLDEASSSPPTNNSGSGSGSGNARPTTARQRTRAAVSEINALVKDRNSSAQESRKPTNAADGSQAQQPRVIDVRSLPRGGMLRGRGGLRGRGRGGAAAGGAPRAASPSGNRFAGAARGRGGSAQGAAGRGGGGFRGRAGGRAGAGKGRATKKAEGGEDGGKAGGVGPRGKRQDPFERMDPQEQQFDDAARFGTRTEYKPSLKKEDLAAFVPAAPSSTRESRLAAVMEDLAVLGGRADPVGVPQNLQAKSYAAEVEGNGARFFADAKAREAAERFLQEQRRERLLAEGKAEEEMPREPIIRDAEEAVRKVVVDHAVQGKHEAPKFATDPVGIARAWHLRAGTYTQRDVERFEKKLVSLLAVGGKGAVKSQAKAS